MSCEAKMEAANSSLHVHLQIEACITGEPEIWCFIIVGS